MTPEFFSQPDPSQPTIYQIRIKGQLDCQWSDWFDGLTISLEEGDVTLLAGPVYDQAELHGLLRKIRDLGIPLISINPIEPGTMPKSRTGLEDHSEVN